MAVNEDSEIQKFYGGKTVFITGATGFVGKLLVEKLLRSCSSIKKLYLLARSKKGKSPETRFRELFDDMIFESMKNSNPNFMDSVEVIEGDIEKPELGITFNDRNKIQNEVEIIIHGAATVNFKISLKQAILSNTRGTREIMDIAKHCEKLRSFVHVSTAYSNCNRHHIREKIYEPAVSAHKIIDVAETFDDDAMKLMAKGLQGDFCNTYVTSKFYAESIVKEYEGLFPIAIVRPSIIMGTQKEPVKGWLTNVFGPQGITLAVGLGLSHVVRLSKKLVVDFVPADKVSNCIVAAAWHVSTLDAAHIRVINCVSRPQNPVTQYKYVSVCDEVGREYYTEKAIGYYSLTITESRLVEIWIWFVTLWLYARIVDAIRILMRKKPRLVEASKKLDEAVAIIDFFTYNEFIFENDNCQEMTKALNNNDRVNFNFDMSDINWHEYFVNCALGIREIIVKDPIESKERARRRQKWLAVIYYGYWIMVLLCFGYLARTLSRIVLS